MSTLLPLALAWLCAPFFLLLNGRRRAVAWAGAGALGAVCVIDLALLSSMVWQAREPLTVVTGEWPSGIGIRLYVDAVSLFFGAVCTLVLAAVMVHEALIEVQSRYFPALLLIMAAGLHGAFFTGDLFNFYVFFELSIVTSFALAAYGYGREEVRGAFIYIVANLLGSVLFLTGIAVVYHATGVLDLAELQQRAEQGRGGIPHLGAALMFAALSLKLGLFPLHGWVPVLYSHAQPAVAAAMSGALINVGAYGLLRIGLFAADEVRADGTWLLLALGGLAVVYGALLAARRENPAEVVAYASIAQAGYVVLALGAGGLAGAIAGLYVVLAGSIEKAALFFSQESMGAARTVSSWIAALGIAGLPVTLGFLAKIALFRAVLTAPQGLILATAVIVGSGFLMVAAVRFCRTLRQARTPPQPSAAAAGLLSGVTVCLAVTAAPLDALLQQLGGALFVGGQP